LAAPQNIAASAGGRGRLNITGAGPGGESSAAVFFDRRVFDSRGLAAAQNFRTRLPALRILLGGHRGIVFALQPGMEEKSLEERVAAVEAQLAEKTLAQRFEDVEKKVDAQLEPIKRDLTTIRHAVNVILARRV
jgi:hypothetical protein